MEIEYYTNKATEQHLAEVVPYDCPNCNGIENFKLHIRDMEGNFNFIEIFTLTHSCGWELDVTPWHLA